MKIFPFACRTENSKREYYNMKIIKNCDATTENNICIHTVQFVYLKKVKLSLYTP